MPSVPSGYLRSSTRPSGLWINVQGNALQCRIDGEDVLVSDETLKETDPRVLRDQLVRSERGFLSARATMTGLGMSGKTRLSRWLVDHPRKWEDIDPADRTIGVDPMETMLDGAQF